MLNNAVIQILSTAKKPEYLDLFPLVTISSRTCGSIFETRKIGNKFIFRMHNRESSVLNNYSLSIMDSRTHQIMNNKIMKDWEYQIFVSCFPFLVSNTRN